MGRTKARVLPQPVRARPTTSRPFMPGSAEVRDMVAQCGSGMAGGRVDGAGGVRWGGRQGGAWGRGRRG
jgi:hypothetical protein